jgi:hypothetical protein
MSDRAILMQNNTATPGDGVLGDDDMSNIENLQWVILWVCFLLLFGCIPFFITRKRRELCWRRIKERRWIVDPEWYVLLLQRQQQRRQDMDRQHEEFQISRTQEDEIREQFLLTQMEKYTIVSIRKYHCTDCTAAHSNSIYIVIYLSVFLT